MTSLTSRFRCLNSWEQIDQIQFHRCLIRCMGHVKWEEDQKLRHQIQMEFFDEETTMLEIGGMIQSELDKRRILVVELRIQHLKFMETVMNFHFEEQRA
jgi:hypothetical protein